MSSGPGPKRPGPLPRAVAALMPVVSRARWPTEGTALPPRPEGVRGRRHAHRRKGSGAGVVLVPLAAVAAVMAVVLGGYGPLAGKGAPAPCAPAPPRSGSPTRALSPLRAGQAPQK